jgi:hypothetical protein
MASTGNDNTRHAISGERHAHEVQPPRPGAPLTEQLVAIERSLWTNDAAVYETTLLPDAVLIFGETGRIDRDFALRAIRQENAEGRRWGEVRFEDVSAKSLAGEIALLIYRAHARWEGDTRLIQADCVTVYAWVDGAWRVALHQQTTPTAGERSHP